jgi:hypothetical protein
LFEKEEVIIMPGGNGTGPMGNGPMTGRGAGYCAGFSVPGFANPVSGRGMGRGFGRGRGFRGGAGFGNPGVPVYQAVPARISVEEEAAAIENEIRYLKDDLKAMEERLTELKKDA